MQKVFLFLFLFSSFPSFSEENLTKSESNSAESSLLEENLTKSESNSAESSLLEENLTKSESNSAESSLLEENLKKSENKLSESFSSEEKEAVEGDGFLTSVFENYSWFFEKKVTKNKLAIVPYFRRSSSIGTILGLRFFTYSTDVKGYYAGTSFSNQIFTSFLKWDFRYTDKSKSGFEVHTYISYDSFSEPFYGTGMNTKESDLKNLYPYKIYWDHEVKYTFLNKFFSSLISQFIFRKERPNLQEGKTYFPSEILIQLKGKIGYDSRDSWRDAKKGHYHQLAFGCIPSLGKGSSFCIGEIDLRYYYSFWDKYSVALRSFVGSSFISQSSYSLNYTLGGNFILRGFSENRFRGDKIYFVQTEFRSPLPFWSKYLSGVVFAELGEVAQYKEKFKNLKWDFGTGLRVGWPSKDQTKLRIDVGFALSDGEKPVNFILDFFQAF